MLADPGNASVQSALDVAGCARLARDTALRQEGVAGMSTGLAEKLGVRKTPGVVARVGQDGWLRMDLWIVARHGVDLLQVGSRVQEAVIAAVRESSESPIGPVNVHVT